MDLACGVGGELQIAAAKKTVRADAARTAISAAPELHESLGTILLVGGENGIPRAEHAEAVDGVARDDLKHPALVQLSHFQGVSDFAFGGQFGDGGRTLPGGAALGWLDNRLGDRSQSERFADPLEAEQFCLFKGGEKIKKSRLSQD